MPWGMVRLCLLFMLLLLAISAPAERAAERLIRLLRKVNATVAHRDHVHIGMTTRGAAARTSFWSGGR